MMLSISYEPEYNADFQAFILQIAAIKKVTETRTIYLDNDTDTDQIVRYAKEMMIDLEIN